MADNEESEVPQVPIGTEINGYKVGKMLGSGAYSSVHIGVKKDSGEKVALKLLSDQDGYRRMQALTEIRLLKELAAVPTVIDLLDVGYWNHCSVLVLPLVGPDLDELRPHGVAYNRGTLLKIGFEMVTILEEVHKKNICHRSIKAPNVCVKNIKNPKSPLMLIDFGMSVKLERSTRRVIPHKESWNSCYHLRSYAPYNEMHPNEWTFQDDLVMLYFMMIRMNDDVDSYQAGSQELTNKKKKAIAKNPKAALNPKSKFLAPFVSMVHGMGWQSIPKYSALRHLLKAAATKSSPLPKQWTYRREEGRLSLN